MSLVTIPWSDDLEAAVRRLEIFSDLSPGDVALLRKARVYEAGAGDKILTRGRAPDGFTFLIEGRWTMRRWPAGASETVVWEDDRPGSWHGGVRAIDAIAPADVVADAPSRLILVSAAVLLKLARTSARVARTLLRGIEGGASLLWSAIQ